MFKKIIPTLFTAGQLLCCGLLFGSARLPAAEKQVTTGGLDIKFATPREGTVLVSIYKGNGTLVRRLVQGEHFTKGAQKLTWDGLLDDGTMAPPGDYTWKGLFHEGIGLKLRGWAGSGGGLPWITPDGKGGWGGDRGVPTAVAADEKKVYLGWSLAEDGKSVLACDLEGRVLWGHRRSEGPSGCKALAVDDGLVYVLGGLEGAGATGGSIYRLDAKDGTPVPWPNGSLDLKLFSLWPADGKTRPDMADAMAVRHGHIYLSFTNSQFLTVLDAKTGAYLQTVVGAPPGVIDVAPTQTPLPDSPDKLSDADFGVISLGDGVLGRILFAHDPFWVVTSDMAPLEENVTVTALSVIGDHGKFHPRTAYLGYGAPHHQVEARSLLNMEEPEWIAGRPGGRPPLGPWQADGLRAVRGVALAGDGKLWVAESDAFPKRFSVWDTAGKHGKLVREFFGPPGKGDMGVAINPLDPDVMFAQGSEWRIDRKTGVEKCLGVVTRAPVGVARYGIGKNGHAYLVTQSEAHPIDIFERLKDGDLKLRTRLFWADESGAEVPMAEAKKLFFWADENADGKMQPNELTHSFPAFTMDLSLPPTQDLVFPWRNVGGSDHPEAGSFISVDSWTACGAPRYDPSRGHALPPWGKLVSSNERLALGQNDGNLDFVFCVGVEGREMNEKSWAFSIKGDQTNQLSMIGAVVLQKPLLSTWVIASEKTGWSILTEDGFELARLFENDPQKIAWPAVATPGAEMSHVATPLSGSIAQGRDGKLYVGVAGSAYLNLEVTGLEKVKALPGGKLTIPPAN